MEKSITFEEAVAVCVQHYVDRGYSVEHATAYVTHSKSEKEIWNIYYIIQEEMKMPQNVATVISLIQPDGGMSAEPLSAEE